MPQAGDSLARPVSVACTIFHGETVLVSRSTDGISEVLTSILRGAAKLLGCTSANLVLLDEKSDSIRVVVATMAAIRYQIGEVEDLVGAVQNVTFPLSMLSHSSLVYRAWKERTAMETASLAEIIGPEVMPMDGVEAAMEMLGDHKFFLVPVMSGSLAFGVLIFEKPGLHPFSPQQRELLIRYAQRVGEIIDMHLRVSMSPEGSGIEGPGESTEIIRFLLDVGGEIRGVGAGMLMQPDGGFLFKYREGLHVLVFPASFMQEVKEHAVDFLKSEDTGLSPVRFRPVTDVNLKDSGFDLRVEVSFSRLTTHEGDLAFVSLHEIRARHELATHQLVRMALGEAAPVVLVGPDYFITSENDAADRLFGYEDGQMAGLAISAIFRDLEDIGDLLNSQIMDLTSGYHEECALLKRMDGECFPGYVEALLLVDVDENLIGYLVRIREQWAPLDKSGGEEHLVRRERLATMGELGAQVAHEIRNPILAIGATLESLSADVTDQSDRETFESLRCEINRLDMLLRDYLSMASKHNASIQPVDICQAVEDIRRLLCGAARWGNRRLVSTVPAKSLVMADPDSIRHILFNLILNAMEATSADGLITVSVDCGERDLAVYVDDDGPGITENPREVFEPFFTTKKNGTGLGLTVCRRIAQILGGAVSLRNREEGGCRASVVLPVPVLSHSPVQGSLL